MLLTSKTGTRRGAVLVEFGLIALALMLFLVVILDFSRAFHGSQVLQQAADVAARELARTPLRAGITFDDALYNPQFDQDVKAKLYDENKLIINLDTLTVPLEQYVAQLPLINQQL